MILLSISITGITYVTNYADFTTNTFAIIHINILFSAIIIVVTSIIFISTTTTTTIGTITHFITATVTRPINVTIIIFITIAALA